MIEYYSYNYNYFTEREVPVPAYV